MLETGFYLTGLATIWAIYFGIKKRNERVALDQREDAVSAGLTEPASLHPVIDPARCRGCGACVFACPEQPDHRVLGLINGRAHLINPTDCIGHGACKEACPHDAITLVFGTEKRGVDIPLLSDQFETNVPGVFIAGELGGMGLIRNAIRQGSEAIEYIAKRRAKSAGNGELDVVIVGAGPAGFAATLGAHKHGLRYRTVEQDSLGGSVFQFPRRKLVMTQPAELPLVGQVRFREITKEALLEFWGKIERHTHIQIHYGERVEDVVRTAKGLCVVTNRGRYTTRAVLLALGRRGTPRKLGVEGEELPKVVYRLIDPEQYRGQRVLVVGGGDAALEAACAIADLPDTTVALSYRSNAFGRAKKKNRERLDAAVAEGRLKLLLSSNVTRILPGQVELEQEGRRLALPNDALIINAGGILPTPFLERIGIRVETKHGVA